MWTRPLTGILGLSLLLSGGGVACSSNHDSVSKQLEDRSFLLQQAKGYEPVSGTTVQLSFGNAALRLNAGCNHLSGRFQIIGDTLVMSELSMTEMGCPEERQAQDTWFADFITSKPILKLDVNTLTLSARDVVLRFLDRELADPDRPLVGPAWRVDTILSRGAATTYAISLPMPILRFMADGTLQLDSGCGAGTGGFASTAAELTFRGVSLTESACADANLALMLDSLLGVMGDGAATYRIEAARLTVQKGDAGFMATAE